MPAIIVAYVWRCRNRQPADIGAHGLLGSAAGGGRYVFHCHNLEHEDMAVTANIEVV